MTPSRRRGRVGPPARIVTAADAIASARRVGLGIEVVGGVPLLSGATAAVREAWRTVLQRHREEIVRLLAPPPPEPAQTTLPGMRR